MPFKITTQHESAVLRRDLNWQHVAPKDRQSGKLTVNGRTYQMKRVEKKGELPSYKARQLGFKGVAERITGKGRNAENEVARVFTRAARMEEGGKQVPYWKNREVDGYVNLNAKLAFDGKLVRGGNDAAPPIACRHLCAAWALDGFKAARPDDGKVKNDYSKVREDAILDLAGSMQEPVYDFLMSNGPTEVVTNKDIGPRLRAHFEAMQPGEERSLMLTTDNHVMVFELKRAKGLGGPDENAWVVKFFDPNSTTTHLRWKPENLASLDKLSLEDLLLDKTYLDAYRPRSTCMMLTHVDADSKQQAVVARQHGDEQGMTTVRHTGRRLSESSWNNLTAAKDAKGLHCAMERLVKSNLGDDIPRLGEMLSQLPMRDRVAMLSSEHVGAALLYNNSEAITGISRLLNQSGIPQQHRIHCFLPANTFASVLRDCQPASVGAYLDMARAHLSGNALFKVLDFDLGKLETSQAGVGEVLDLLIARLADPGLRLSDPQQAALIDKYAVMPRDPMP